MEEDRKLHIAMFPWLAFGHLVPFLELAKLMAQRGHRISFLSTPRNIARLPEIPPHLVPLITFVPLTFPRDDGNRLPGAEATSDLPYHRVPYLKMSFDALQPSVSTFLHSSVPDWIIYDFASHWLPPVAGQIGIKKAYFSIFSAWFMAFMGSYKPILAGENPRKIPEDYTSPPEWIPFPSNARFPLYAARQVISVSEQNASGVADIYRWAATISESDLLAIRSCRKMEGEWLEVVEEINGKPVVPVGLMPRSSDENDDERFTHIDAWLSERVSASVVYIALGSEAVPTQSQLTELALGLELSGVPFFWALRAESGSLELPAGFEERVAGRGMVWKGWAPQLRILSHGSVGGFLTHCGWSSVIEGLQFGLPLIMLPFLWDQSLNAKVLAEKKVGVEIPRGEEDGSLAMALVAESLKLVMVEPDGAIHRENAKDCAKILDGTLQGRYVDDFIQHLQKIDSLDGAGARA